MPKWLVTACYYDSIEVEADTYADAIDAARGPLKSTNGNLIFDSYEAERIDDEEDDCDD